MADVVAAIADPQALRAARTFLHELAAGRHPDVYSLEDEPFERHVALAQVGCEELTNPDSRIRRAAAWVVGAVDVHEGESIPRLGRLLRDRGAVVRMAAVWACEALGEDAAANIPGLAAALADPSRGVRFAAAAALGAMGAAGRSAVEALLALTGFPHPMPLRVQALTAASRIAPEEVAVRSALVRALEDPDADLRFAAACGLVGAGPGADDVTCLLASNLESGDPYLVCVTAWAVGKLAGNDGAVVPGLLTAMGQTQWMPVAHPDGPAGEAVGVRDDLEDALAVTLPPTDDEEYAGFRTLFLHNAFHPTPHVDPAWVEAVVHHAWYLKLQRRRFGHPTTAADRAAVRDAVRDAQAKFAARLRKNPTLGLTPPRFRLLPGFVKMHTRNIAWRLRQQRADRVHRAIDVESLADPRASAAEDAEGSLVLRDLIETQLPPGERAVARCRWAQGYTIVATAAALNLTPSQVKTRERKARERAAAYLDRLDGPSPSSGPRKAAPRRQ